MGSNSSSIVISFSIAILLLLILLLLLSYNSKCKNDSVERFETGSDQSTTYNYGGNPFDGAYNDLTTFASDTVTGGYDFASNVVKQTGGFVQNFSDNIASVFPQGGDATTTENFENLGSSIQDGFYSSLTGTGDQKKLTDRDKLTSKDLLPSNASSDNKIDWAQINPKSLADLSDQNFLTAGYHMGINTVGQSMRNANLQLRSEIPNPQVAVSPWGISTIEPDLKRVSFEIGSAPSK